MAPAAPAFQGAALIRTGDQHAVRLILDELRAAVAGGQVDHLPIALLEEAFGNESAALDALEAAHRERAPLLVTLPNAGWLGFERVRGHPRFRRLLEAMGLPIVDLVGEREKVERRMSIPD